MGKFFTFTQNNSGGYNIINDVVAKNLIIESENAEEAITEMFDITSSYSSYCGCCGERWNDLIDDEDGEDKPMVYDIFYDTNVPAEELDGQMKQETIIYYSSGETRKLWY